MNRRKGFTLVELLVVIAIIALLMGILMPALARVRRAARDTACMVQMKQWGTVYSMYTGDFEGYFLADYTNPTSGTPQKIYWWEVMESYYKDATLLLCPAATKVRNVTSTGEPKDGHEGGEYPFCSSLARGAKVSVAYNGWLGEEGGMSIAERKAEWRWQTVNRIKQPNTVPVIGDSYGWPRKFPFGDTRNEPSKITSPTVTPDELGIGGMSTRIFEYALRRHGPQSNANINVSFADFSVRPVGLKALWSLRWHRDWRNQRSIDIMTDREIWPDWMKDYSTDGVIDYRN